MKYCILSNCLNIINIKEMNDAKHKISKLGDLTSFHENVYS
jgi:hypothetical protein